MVMEIRQFLICFIKESLFLFGYLVFLILIFFIFNLKGPLVNLN